MDRTIRIIVIEGRKQLVSELSLLIPPDSSLEEEVKKRFGGRCYYFVGELSTGDVVYCEDNEAGPDNIAYTFEGLEDVPYFGNAVIVGGMHKRQYTDCTFALERIRKAVKFYSAEESKGLVNVKRGIRKFVYDILNEQAEMQRKRTRRRG